ncbi:MAG: glucose-1-phosphate cytidylyltransferase, partial [Nitrosarchaeum sp.]|nr:glucose-1-phosphate cytidylyltransferase [Nitrosarchaeum sp.]
ATITAVQPPGRFGILEIENDDVLKFKEKPEGDGNWINGGFFVLEPSVFDYIKGDSTTWEREPLEKLSHQRALSVYKHKGFWHAVDTLRDKNHLEELWTSGKASWKIWE